MDAYPVHLAVKYAVLKIFFHALNAWLDITSMVQIFVFLVKKIVSYALNNSAASNVKLTMCSTMIKNVRKFVWLPVPPAVQTIPLPVSPALLATLWSTENAQAIWPATTMQAVSLVLTDTVSPKTIMTLNCLWPVPNVNQNRAVLVAIHQILNNAILVTTDSTLRITSVLPVLKGVNSASAQISVSLVLRNLSQFKPELSAATMLQALWTVLLAYRLARSAKAVPTTVFLVSTGSTWEALFASAASALPWELCWMLPLLSSKATTSTLSKQLPQRQESILTILWLTASQAVRLSSIWISLQTTLQVLMQLKQS